MESLLEAAGAALTTRRGNLPPGRFNETHDEQFYYYVYDQQQPRHNRGFIYWCWRFLIISSKLAVLFLLSVGSYAIFYQLNQPRILVFQKFQFDYYGAKPSSTVDLHAKHNQWKPLLEDIDLISRYKRILRPGQAYYVELVLKLPESQLNLDSGMFGVNMELYGMSNETSRLLATSRRFLRFPYRSQWVRVVATAVSLPSLLLHAADEAQTVRDYVFRHVLESETYALHTIFVQLLEHVEVIAAEIKVGEELSPFQELIKVWFWTCFLFGSMVFATVYFAMYQIVTLWLSRSETFLEEPSCDLNFEELSIHNSLGDGANGSAANNRPMEEEIRRNEPDLNTPPRARQATRSPPGEIAIPDGFGDGSDAEWEDLSVAENETRTLRSEASIHARSMTSADLRRYLNRNEESEEEVHPFLVFMDD